MLADLFQLQQKPVTTFSSSDANAPILTNAAGSLKSLLKACLVTGYGEKTALGWEVAFESEDLKTAVFRSKDATSHKACLRVNNAASGTAKISAYQTMTDVDTGTKIIGAQRDYPLAEAQWMLIGHSKAFVLLVDVLFEGERVSYTLLFGDLPKQTNKSNPHSVFWCSRPHATGRIGGVMSTLMYNTNGSSGTSNWGSGYDSIGYMTAYPFAISTDIGSQNLIHNNSYFTYSSLPNAPTLHAPIISRLDDGTWTLLPMLQPLSAKLDDIPNRGTLNTHTIKARTGGGVPAFNDDVAIPTNWWYV